MPMKLYYMKLSPPVRATMLTAHNLELDLERKPVDLLKKEQFDPEFVKINPMHTLPTLDDNGFVLFDSHAICGYLVTKYAKTDALYPREASARATVDQRLHFDSGILFPRLRAVSLVGDTYLDLLTFREPIFMKNERIIPEDKKEAVVEAYDFLDKLLGDNQWVAGDHMTIADFCCVSTVTTVQIAVPVLEKFPNVLAWIQRCETLIPGYKEIIQEGVDAFQIVFSSAMNS